MLTAATRLPGNLIRPRKNVTVKKELNLITSVHKKQSGLNPALSLREIASQPPNNNNLHRKLNVPLRYTYSL